LQGCSVKQEAKMPFGDFPDTTNYPLLGEPIACGAIEGTLLAIQGYGMMAGVQIQSGDRVYTAPLKDCRWGGDIVPSPKPDIVSEPSIY
jgi:hypothetical protein